MVRLRAKPNPKLELQPAPGAHEDEAGGVRGLRLDDHAAGAHHSGGHRVFGGAAVHRRPGHHRRPLVLIFLVLIVVMLPPILTYVVLNSTPGSKAKSRGRDIDKRIGPAMSFISAMASADVNVDVIFKELSRQKIYGEIQNEAEWITRDTELLGIDILTAISKAAQRTPSQQVPGVPAGCGDHLHLGRPAQAVLPAEGRAVREGGASWRCGRSWNPWA